MIASKSYGLQNETRQYLRRLYAYGKELAGADIADIDNFIKGLKQLNLWHSIICWPMRSIHNIGSGNIVLSLGGFHKKDATLISGSATFPSWGINGIIITATDQGVSTNVNLEQVFGSRGLFSSVFRLDNTNNEGRRIITCDIPGFTQGYGMDDVSAPNIRFLASGGTGTVPLSNFNPNFGFLTTGKAEAPIGQKTFVNNTINNITTSNFPVTYPSSTLGIGGRHLVNGSGISSPVVSKLQTNSLLISYRTHISFQEHQFIYSLIKQTIGKGLGLP